MKKYILYTMFAALGLMAITSCSNFGDTNVDPEHLNDGNVNYKLLFTNSEHQALGSDWDVWRNGCIYSATMMQHTTSVDWDQVFYTYNETFNTAFWDGLYKGGRGVIRDIKIVMKNWKDDASHAADYQMARILKVFMFHRMTDLYGDVPYTEAGDPSVTAYPKYDKQQDIYSDMLNELNEAQAALSSTTSTLGSADLYYGGNVTKWRKFANSLMLRIAMRMSKVDPTTAQKWVQTAVNNGLIDSYADDAILNHTDGDPNNDSAEPWGKIYSSSDPQAFYLSEYFVNLLKNSNDPRMALIGVVVAHPANGYSSSSYEKGNSDPSVQVGMPVGYTTTDGTWSIKKAPGYPGDNFRSYYSLPSRYTYADPKAPTMIVTYAENQLLLAEAAYRGWLNGVSGAKTAKEYYEAGVTAAMKQFAHYTNGSSLYTQYITDAAIKAYLEANPYDASKALEQINTQYYILTFCDDYETFANWRRSGYPQLTPVNKSYPNTVTNGTIPRRFTYPSSESQSNSANYQEAVSRLSGGDKMTSRVWWDVEK